MKVMIMESERQAMGIISQNVVGTSFEKEPK